MSPAPSPSSSKAPTASGLHHRQGNTCQVTRAVQTMSSLHNTSMTSTLRKYFYSPKHFPKILGGVMVASGIAGYAFMGHWHDRKMEERKRVYVEAYHNGERREGSGLASLARKMTHRIVPSSRSMFAERVETSGLQRQVTKFW